MVTTFSLSSSSVLSFISLLVVVFPCVRIFFFPDTDKNPRIFIPHPSSWFWESIFVSNPFSIRILTICTCCKGNTQKGSISSSPPHHARPMPVHRLSKTFPASSPSTPTAPSPPSRYRPSSSYPAFRYFITMSNSQVKHSIPVIFSFSILSSFRHLSGGA